MTRSKENALLELKAILPVLRNLYVHKKRRFPVSDTTREPRDKIADVAARIRDLSESIYGSLETYDALMHDIDSVWLQDGETWSDLDVAIESLCLFVENTIIKFQERSYGELEITNSVFEERIEGLLEEREELKQKLDGVREDLYECESQVKELLNDIKKSKLENQKLNREIITIQSELSRLETEKEQLRMENQRLNGEIITIQSELSRLETEKEQLRMENNELEYDAQECRNKVSYLEFIVSRFREREDIYLAIVNKLEESNAPEYTDNDREVLLNSCRDILWAHKTYLAYLEPIETNQVVDVPFALIVEIETVEKEITRIEEFLRKHEQG